MEEQTPKAVFANYQDPASDFSVRRLTSGHINQTYVVTNAGQRVILQKINTAVFKNLEEVKQNNQTIAIHLKDQNYPHPILSPLAFANGELLWDNQWRLFPFFCQTQTFERVQSDRQVFNAAEFLSEFHAYLCDLEAAKLQTALPRFLDFQRRYENFGRSLTSASQERLHKAEGAIEDVFSQVSLLKSWQETLPKMPQRIIHADPKISNFLFDAHDPERIKALIDWDTFMQGPILYDFGDMVRSYTNLKAEDDPAENGRHFSAKHYKALKKGFLHHLDEKLTTVELEHMDLAGGVVIYMQAIRFLTDYLNGDVYYAVEGAEHNLDRTKNQLNLLRELREFQRR